jgi:hypothetical protein
MLGQCDDDENVHGDMDYVKDLVTHFLDNESADQNDEEGGGSEHAELLPAHEKDRGFLLGREVVAFYYNVSEGRHDGGIPDYLMERVESFVGVRSEECERGVFQREKGEEGDIRERHPEGHVSTTNESFIA